MEDIWKIPDDIAKKSKEKRDRIDCYYLKLIPILKGENISPSGTAPIELAIIKLANEFIETEGKSCCSEEVKKRVGLMNPKTLSKDVEEIIALIDKEIG